MPTGKNKTEDKMKIRGRLKIEAFEGVEDPEDLIDETKRASANKVYEHNDPNVIVNDGRIRVLELLSGLSTNPFNRISIGDAGTSETDNLVPIAPSIEDDSLNHKLAVQVVDTRTILEVGTPAQFTLRYTAVFVASDFATGLPFLDEEVFNEAAIESEDNVILARKTFPSIPFTQISNMAILFSWDLTIA